MTAAKADYWTSPHEMFARCFERHIQHKLEKAGRQNTYLSGLTVPGGLWPTDEETKALEPYFDAIFREFKNSELLHKAMRLPAFYIPREAPPQPVDILAVDPATGETQQVRVHPLNPQAVENMGVAAR